MTNAQVFDAAKKKLDLLIQERMNESFYRLGQWLIEDAELQAEYRNLTGNTITSIAFGLYKGGALDEICFIEGKQPPVRVKLRYRESVIDFLDYDGNVRSFLRAPVDTDGGFGRNTSAQFLLQYKPEYPDGIVICTGTEYSSFLETTLGFNVLTDTRESAIYGAKAQLLASFRKI